VMRADRRPERIFQRLRSHGRPQGRSVQYRDIKAAGFSPVSCPV
jgi:hypothetical protein